MIRFPVAINLNPYQGLKQCNSSEDLPILVSRVAINLNPYQGLKLPQEYVRPADGVGVAINLNPYQGLKQT